MKPINAKTDAQVCDLKSSEFLTGDFWIITDGAVVSIVKQRNGCLTLDIPRDVFNKLVRWYVRDQKPRKQKTGS